MNRIKLKMSVLVALSVTAIMTSMLNLPVVAAARQLGGSRLAADTTVQQESLSQLQTDFSSEADRRVKALKDGLSTVTKLTQAQQDLLNPLLNAEIGTISGLKTRANTESTLDAFNVDKGLLDGEYASFLLLTAQPALLLWADDQAVLESKYNTLGGKFQERLNDASSQGESTADAQVALNNFQAHKVNAQNATSAVLRTVPTIKAGDYNANRAVLKTYSDQLSTAHTELESAIQNASQLVGYVKKF